MQPASPSSSSSAPPLQSKKHPLVIDLTTNEDPTTDNQPATKKQRTRSPSTPSSPATPLSNRTSANPQGGHIIHAGLGAPLIIKKPSQAKPSHLSEAESKRLMEIQVQFYANACAFAAPALGNNPPIDELNKAACSIIDVFRILQKDFPCFDNIDLVSHLRNLIQLDNENPTARALYIEKLLLPLVKKEKPPISGAKLHCFFFSMFSREARYLIEQSSSFEDLNKTEIIHRARILLEIQVATNPLFGDPSRSLKLPEELTRLTDSPTSSDSRSDH